MFMIVRPTKKAFSYMGMNKSGNFNMPNSGNYKITSWTASSGMAADIVNDGLVMNGLKILNINWGYSTNLNNAWGTAEIRKNNVVIANGLYGTGILSNISVISGDVITMHGNNSYPGSQTVNATGTYLYTS